MFCPGAFLIFADCFLSYFESESKKNSKSKCFGGSGNSKWSFTIGHCFDAVFKCYLKELMGFLKICNVNEIECNEDLITQ